MSEKFDGIRAYWDGKEIYSRQANVMSIPKSFKESLPKIALDGELWYFLFCFPNLTPSLFSEQI